MNIRAELKADGETCLCCGAPLWKSKWFDRIGATFTDEDDDLTEHGTALLVLCPKCNVINPFRWVVDR